MSPHPFIIHTPESTIRSKMWDLRDKLDFNIQERLPFFRRVEYDTMRAFMNINLKYPINAQMRSIYRLDRELDETS